MGPWEGGAAQAFLEEAGLSLDPERCGGLLGVEKGRRKGELAPGPSPRTPEAGRTSVTTLGQGGGLDEPSVVR